MGQRLAPSLAVTFMSKMEAPPLSQDFYSTINTYVIDLPSSLKKTGNGQMFRGFG